MKQEEAVQTGPYIHASDNIEEIRFPSQGDVDRSFTVIIASHAHEEPDDVSRAGIAILDNDNSKVVFDGLLSGKDPESPLMTFRFASIPSLNWAQFNKLCRENPRYCGDIEDIDTPEEEPMEGNFDRQAALGLMPQLDARSVFIREISANRDVPYKFPPLDREGMAQEICRHKIFVEQNGPRSHIAWDIRMNMNWNRTGRIKDLGGINPEQDANWRHTIENQPELTSRACADAISPYVSGPTHTLDMEKFPCEFEQVGENGGFLILKKFCGYYMSATRDMSFPDRILRLNDAQLEALWVTCRVMDQDLSLESRLRDMEYQMHIMRRSFEAGQLELA
jgi:hypothetical protein